MFLDESLLVLGLFKKKKKVCVIFQGMCQCIWCLCYLSVCHFCVQWTEWNTHAQYQYIYIYIHTVHSCWWYMYIYVLCCKSSKLPSCTQTSEGLCVRVWTLWVFLNMDVCLYRITICMCLLPILWNLPNLFVAHDYLCILSSRNLSTTPLWNEEESLWFTNTYLHKAF